MTKSEFSTSRPNVGGAKCVSANGWCVKICPYFLGFFAYFQHFEPPLFLLPLILTINLSILFNFQLKSTATCLFCTMPINRTYFLEKPISFTLSSLLFYLAKHHPFSPSPHFLFLNLNKFIGFVFIIDIIKIEILILH